MWLYQSFYAFNHSFIQVSFITVNFTIIHIHIIYSLTTTCNVYVIVAVVLW